MLQFIYTGDYTVVSGGDIARSASQLCVELQGPQQVSIGQDLLPSTSASTIAANDAGAHGDVYAIAVRYDISGVEDLALKKYSDSIIALDIEDFTDVTGAVYTSTSELDDGLRMATADAALQRFDELTCSTSFMQVLYERSSMQGLAVQMLQEAMIRVRKREADHSAILHAAKADEGETNALYYKLCTSQMMCTKLIERVEVLEGDHVADKQRLKDALMAHSAAVDDKEGDLEALCLKIQQSEKASTDHSATLSAKEEEVKALRHEIQQTMDGHQQLVDVVQGFKEDLQKQDQGAESNRSEIAKLKDKLRQKTDEAKVLRQSRDAAVQAADAAKAGSKAMSAQCTTNYDHYKAAQAQVDRLQLQLVATQTQLNQAQNTNRNITTQREGLRSEALQQVLRLVDEWEECRNCHEDLNVWLELEYFTGGPKMILRCLNCRARHRCN